MSESSAAPLRDETVPTGGGIFRRISPATAGFAGVFSAVEVVYAPSAHQAREELERQKIAGARNPSDTDPPDDLEAAPRPRTVAPGRPGTPFSGAVVLHPQPHP